MFSIIKSIKGHRFHYQKDKYFISFFVMKNKRHLFQTCHFYSILFVILFVLLFLVESLNLRMILWKLIDKLNYLVQIYLSF
jgi:hypothetical protein